jgi:uncharacterized protein YgbK (DUF1537 family)
MPSLRLVADDLTGALDSAAAFVGLCGPIPVKWSGISDDTGTSLAIDSGTRERSASEAAARASALGPFLNGGDIAFKKVDSLLRGPWAAELAACFALGHWLHCVMAPAFPHHGRHTLNGRQWARSEDGSWRDVGGGDLATHLRAQGRFATSGRIADGLQDGVTIFDAAAETDLMQIASLATAQARGPILWCGAGGLARALACGHHFTPLRALEKPILGFFGSDQAAMQAQLEACRPHWMTVGRESDVVAIAHRLAGNGVAMVAVELPTALRRQEAAARIASAFDDIVAGVRKPGTLIVAGGETLRSVCMSLGATSLDVIGEIEPGVPRSVMRGGLWDGVAVVSKSGAFGGRHLWRDLLIENGFMKAELD